MSTHALNEQQRAAVEATGEVFVSAGAGTGKTAVLVERVSRAVLDRGLDVDSILVITYTRRAAGELRTRIRAALAERGRHDLARELDGAWISTIHGFCARLLKAYPLAAGLDPRFRELDDAQSAVLRSEAFAEALTEFLAGDDRQRLELSATYGSAGLRRMLTTVYETLRAAGRDLDLAVAPRPELAERVEELRAAAHALAGDPDVTDAQGRAATELLALLEKDVRPDRLMSLGGFKARGDRAAAYSEALEAVQQAALDEAAARDRALLQELLDAFAARYAEAKARESALDFEDLQLGARDLLRSHPEIREREQLRFREILVDEFQDTNALQTEIVELLRTPDTELFFVGDEFQSIYGFRHADVAVFRERREAAATLLSLTNNYRSRPEVLATVNHLFSSHFGSEFQELTAAVEFPDPVFGHPVELLVTDKESYKDTPEHWRRGEARAVARRVRELVDAGTATPGEIVLLFAAGTDAEWYEQELRREGLPTYRATGKGYFGQQQVADMLMYLGSCRTAMTTRRSSRCSRRRSSASRTTRSRLSAARRSGSRSSPGSSTTCRRGSLSATSGSCARSGSATTGSSPRCRGSPSSASASSSSPSTTTTWPCSRTGMAVAGTRICASSRGSRARTRSCAARTSRASSVSSPSRRRSAPTRARPWPRRRAPTSCGS